MKVLTVQQPWAWAIIHAGKDIENRSWSPPASLIGERFAIHAGLTADAHAMRRARGRTDWPPTYCMGSIIGTVKLEGVSFICERRDYSEWGDPCARVHWHLTNPRPLFDGCTIPVQGKQGLWEFSVEGEDDDHV